MTRPDIHGAEGRGAAGDAALRHRVQRWLDGLSAALAARDVPALADLFESGGHWRDLLALTPRFSSASGAAQVAARLGDAAAHHSPSGFRIAEGYSPPKTAERAGVVTVQAFVAFETGLGRCIGVVGLTPRSTSDAPRASSLLTALDELGAAPWQASRPAGLGFDRTGNIDWSGARTTRLAFADREPEVLVVGGGHCGLMISARLRRLGVDTLVVDRYDRVGDNWRSRYRSLALHNETDVVHLPYLPYPDQFPEYLPKDKLADWLEFYADSLELDVWSGTEFVGGEYVAEDDTWRATVVRDGTQRVLRPRHIVMSTGAGYGGEPHRPALPGLESFTGPVLHSSEYSSGAPFAGQEVLVVGAATSAHDVAQDLDDHGAHATMLQRSPTIVVSLESANAPYSLYTDGITPTREADLIGAAGFVFPAFRESLKSFTKDAVQRDADLLSRLESAGMQVEHGEDETGYLLKALRTGGGYYIDVGCSDLIARGRVGVRQASEVVSFDATGVRFDDGCRVELDAVVLATGYLNRLQYLRQMFGDEIGDRIGDVGGLDGQGEIRNAWVPTGQRGLWFMLGSISHARTYSFYLALQVKAELAGITLAGPTF